MAPPTDWLGPLIERELSAVIEWKQHATWFKHDPDRRLTDDGSNFYSTCRGSYLPSDARLQIVKVLTGGNTATIIVSDGFTQARAVLSKDVTATLEAKIGEPLSTDTTADVFNVRGMLIVSTPLGPPDGFIHLRIQDVEYEHHLRKVYDNSTPIEEREEVRKLIDVDLTTIRQRQYPGEGESHGSPVDLTSDDAEAGMPQQGARRNKQAAGGAQQSQRSGATSQSSTSLTQQATRSSGAFATQPQLSRKPTGPSIENEGFEVGQGVNLQGPQGANFRSPNDRLPSRSKDTRIAVDRNTTNLLNLLRKGKRKAEDVTPAAAPPAKSPHVETPSAAASENAQAEPAPQRTVRSRSSSPDVVEVERTKTHKSPSAPSTDATTSDIVRRSPSHLRKASATSPSTRTERTRMMPPPSAIRLRRIPRDQQKLLDQQCSWLPSLPGKSFPHPNVPVAVLKQWNAAAAASAAAPPINAGMSEPTSHARDENARTDGQKDGSQPSGESDSESSSSSEPDDESPPLSGWLEESSQPPRRDELPPDSTMDNTANASPLLNNNRTLLPPDSSNESSGKVHETNERRSSAPRMPNALPQKPYWLSSQQNSELDHGQDSSNQDYPSSQALNLHTEAVTRRASLPRSPNAIPASSRPAQPSHTLDGSADNEQHSLQSERSPPAAVATVSAVATPYKAQQLKHAQRTSSHTSPPSVIKATPVNNAAAIEDELELSVPRTFKDEDPAIEHHRRRREHFAEATAKRRVAWIQQNYHVSPDSGFPFPRIYAQYKKAKPHDSIRLSQFAAALNECFPETRDSNAGLAERSPNSKQDVVSPLLPRLRHSAADTGRAGQIAEGIPLQLPQQSRIELSANGWFLKDSVQKQPAVACRAVGATPRRSVFAGFARLTSELQPHSNGTTPVSKRRLLWKLDESMPNVPTTLDSSPLGTVGNGERAPDRISSVKWRYGGRSVSTTNINPRKENKRTPLAERGAGTSGSSVFGGFAEAWKNLRPPGVFALAGQDETGARQRPVRRQLNVLSWEL